MTRKRPLPLLLPVLLLPTDVPLVGRGSATAAGEQHGAGREVAGPHGLSGSWVADHAIHTVKVRSLSGAFALRAIYAPGKTTALK